MISNAKKRLSGEKIESPEQLMLSRNSMNISSSRASSFDSANVSRSQLHNPCHGILEYEEGDVMLSIAVNNYSICCMYLKQINEAIKVMEELIQESPIRHMTDAVIFNLCTMYDLTCSQEVSGAKKKTLQQIANMFNVADLHWKSFRLT